MDTLELIQCQCGQILEPKTAMILNCERFIQCSKCGKMMKMKFIIKKYPGNDYVPAFPYWNGAQFVQHKEDTKKYDSIEAAQTDLTQAQSQTYVEVVCIAY